MYAITTHIVRCWYTYQYFYHVGNKIICNKQAIDTDTLIMYMYMYMCYQLGFL